MIRSYERWTIFGLWYMVSKERNVELVAQDLALW